MSRFSSSAPQTPWDMTMRTLSDICFALDVKPIFALEGETLRSASTPTG
jgi:hypothetical protein